MNHELKKCREHYEQLLPHSRKLNTSQHLLTAIQIAENALDSLKTCRELCDEVKASEAALKRELARVTKSDGQ